MVAPVAMAALTIRARRGALLAAVLAILAPLALAQPELEAAVKAAYLYKFAGYVEWPASALPSGNAPLVIGVAGADAVFAQLEAMLLRRTVNGRPVVARRLREGDPTEGVHVLYAGAALAGSAWLRALRGRPLLLVSDAPEGLREGALNFVIVDGRVRFEASLPSAERAGLKLSSRLLAVAERVVSP